MRELSTEGDSPTIVRVLDEPGEGGGCHRYRVDVVLPDGTIIIEAAANIQFQKGPIDTVGANGCQNEDLLAIVLDRLEHFQRGPFPCTENNAALDHIERARHWLERRTKDRRDRGVGGKGAA